MNDQIDEKKIVCFTQEIPKEHRLEGSDKVLERGWLKLDDLGMPLCVDFTSADNFTSADATYWGRKLLGAGAMNIYTYSAHIMEDDCNEATLVAYYTPEEYNAKTGGTARDLENNSLGKLQKEIEEAKTQPRPDPKAVAANCLAMLFPDGVNIKSNTEWLGYNAITGIVNSLSAYCEDLQVGGGGGMLAVMDIMRDAKKLLELEGYAHEQFHEGKNQPGVEENPESAE